MVEIVGALGRPAPSDRVRRRRGRPAGESEPATEIAMKVWFLRTLAAKRCFELGTLRAVAHAAGISLAMSDCDRFVC